MTEHVLSAVSPSEAAAFLEIMLECWRGTVPTDSTAYRETPETLAAALSGHGYGVLLHHQGQAIGCGRTVTVPGPRRDSRAWIEIKRVGVLAHYRGQGLGERILAALEAEARSRGVGGGQLAVRSDQPRLVDFWRTLGYAIADDVILTTPNPLTPPPIHMRKWFAAEPG